MMVQLLEDSLSDQPRSEGRCHQEFGGDRRLPRRDFQRLINAMSRAGYIEAESASFDKGGRTIRYRTLRRARHMPAEPLETLIRMDEDVGAKSKKKKKKRRAAPQRMSADTSAHGGPVSEGAAHDGPVANEQIVDELKAWRLARARQDKVPAYVIMPNATIAALAAHLPQSESELREIHGLGPARIERYGEELLAELRSLA